MKSLALVLALVISSASFASYVSYPQVNFGGHYIGYNNVCLDGDMFATTFAIKDCIAYSNNSDGATCIAFEEKILTTETSYTVEVCANRGCSIKYTEERNYSMVGTAQVLGVRGRVIDTFKVAIAPCN